MAKKTTTAKPATKKPAAKSTAKKTTTIKSATKPSAKKVAAKPAAKPEVKKATEISVSGNKKIGTLQKEFNKLFPFVLHQPTILFAGFLYLLISAQSHLMLAL